MTNKDVDRSPKTKPRFFYGYVVVVAAFITQIFMYGPRASYGVFFKPMEAEFGWSRALISGAFSISVIVQGLTGIVMGGLNDRFGPRVVMTLCGVLLGLGFLLMSQINTPWQLYLFYVVIVGTGMGGIFAPPFSTLARWFVKRRGVMTGIVIAGGGTGGIIVPPVANWLISTYGWRDAYAIIGVAVLVIVILAAQFLRRDPAKMGQVPYGENIGQEQELNLDAEGLSLKEANRTSQFWMAISMLFCFGVGVSITRVHLVPHAIDLGISAATAANILAASGGALVAGGIVLGMVADRIGNRQTLGICFILISAAMFWLLIARESWMFYLFAILIGAATGAGAMLEPPLVAELFGIKSHGLILGIVECSITIGAAVGPFITGYIFDVYGSYQLAFLICAAAGVVGLILSAALRPIKRRYGYGSV
jgi:MFS family permease